MEKYQELTKQELINLLVLKEKELEGFREILNKDKSDLLKKYGIIIDSTTDLVLITDLNGIITFNNKAVTDQCLYGEDELIGKPVSILWKEEHTNDLVNLIDDLLEGKEIVNMETYCLDKYGNEVPILMSLKGIKNSSGDVVELFGISKEIGSLKQIQYALQESEEKYRLLHENAALGIGYYTPDGMVISYNSVASKNMGGKPEDFVGKSVFDLFPKDAAKEYFDRIQKAISSDNVIEYEDYVQLPNQDFWFLSTYTKIVNSKNEILGIQIISQDISNQKEAEEALRKSLIDLKLAQKIACIGNWELNPETGILVWSNLVYEIYERDLALGPPHIDEYKKMYEPDQFNVFNTAIQKAIKHGIPYDITLKLILPVGNIKWIHAICQPDKKKGKSGHYLRGTIQDITDQKQAEEDLKKQNDFIQKILDHFPIGIATNEIDSLDVTYINPKFAEIYGWPKEEFPNVADFFNKVFPDPENREKLQKQIMEDIGSGDPNRMNWDNLEITTQKGEKKLVHAYNIPLIEQNIMISTVQDITDIKNAEIVLRESKDRFTALVNNLQSGVIYVDTKGKIIEINPALIKILGSPSIVESKKINVLEYPPLVEFGYSGKLQECIDNKKIIFGEGEYTSKWSKTLYIEFYFVPIFHNDTVIGVLSCIDDITKEKEQEELIKQNLEILTLGEEIADIGYYERNWKTGKGFWSEGFYKLLGGNKGEIECTHEVLATFFHPDDRAYVENYIRQSIINRSFMNVEFRLVQKGGNEIYIRGNGKTVYDELGQPISTIGTFQNITNYKNTQEELENHRNNLETLVKERTEELELKNKELERFNNLFVGREFRINELKEKVNELEKELANYKQNS